MLRPSGGENSRLSSTRLVTDATGTEVENTDYLPFGEEILVSGTSARHNVAAYGESGLLRHKFTGKERDSESGMDYFLARYYSGPMGRFLSVDPNNAGAGLTDPQTWNAYAYVRNQPTVNVDPDGRVIETAFDVFSLATGVASFVSNVREGNVGAAALDAVGVVVDTAAVVLPGVPGGAGAGLKALRAGGKAADAVQGLKKAEQGRDKLGRFLPKKGGEVRPGALAEDKISDAIGNKEGFTELAKQVTLENADGKRRVIDSVVQTPSGKNIGIEVKGGNARRTRSQREFDQGVTRRNPAQAVGSNARKAGIEQVDRIIEIREESLP